MTDLAGQVRELGEVSADKLPLMPLVALEELPELTRMGSVEIETLALLLESTHADGVVLLVGSTPVGVLPWEALASELEPLASGQQREQLYGQPASDVRC